MKKFTFAILAVVLSLFTALPAQSQVPSITYTAQAGVTLFTPGTSATATQTSAAVTLPNKSAEGNLLITTTGITGSPSGCSIALYSMSNVSATAPAAAEQTPSVTISTGTHTQVVAAVSASDATADALQAIYACSTYPTAGTLSVTFAPMGTNTFVTNTVTVSQLTTGDPCANPQVAKSSAVVNISGAAGTTQLVAVSGTKATYVCNFQATVVGTTPTILFEYGTSTTCVGTTALTGTMAIVTTSTVNMGYGGTIITAPASNGLCLVAGGTTPSIQGVLTYVQQ